MDDNIINVNVPPSPFVIGILPGEGIGPEIIHACLAIIDVIQACTSHHFVIRQGGNIGLPALRESGAVLTPEVIDFCTSIFAVRGAILCGPGGGRFVYDLRKEFDIYCKLVPIKPFDSMRNVSVLKPSKMQEIDILIVRENIGGLYQGTFLLEENNGCQQAKHSFVYDEHQVKRILQIAIEAAKKRRKKLCVITKPGGVPTISALWYQQAVKLVGNEIELQFLEVDHAAYQIIANARNFDVVVAPNMFGDIIADGAALLLGSRGLSYSANFGDNGVAVYQTGHGSAHDIAGQDKANPLGQLQTFAMMLRESFGLVDIASHLLSAIEYTLAQGWRTFDIMEPGCTEVGTHKFTQRIVENMRLRLSKHLFSKTTPTIRPALLLIDLQNDFLTRLDSTAAKDLVSRTAKLLTFCREQQIPILHIRTKTSSTDEDRMPHWIRNNYYACIEGTYGAESPVSLQSQAGERVLYKRYFNAFHHTALSDVLASFNVDTLIIAGLYLHGCIRSTALHAYEQGYTVWIAEDAVASNEPMHAEMSRHWLNERAASFISICAIQNELCKEVYPEVIALSEKSLPVANINNCWKRSENLSATIINKNPSNLEKTQSVVAIADANIAANAAYAAYFAWSSWRVTSMPTRIALLQRFEQELQNRIPTLRQLLIDEIGKPWHEANEEIKRALAHIKHTLSFVEDKDKDNVGVKLHHRPVGCYAIITPWNNPVSTPISKIVPALFFGNTVLWKPAPQAPCVSMLMMEALIAAGLNEGCVNLLFGDESTARTIITQPLVTAVSITGSITTGRSVSALCGMLEKPLQAELGGNNACIILADVNLTEVIDNLALAAFSFAGQRCTAIRRFIIEDAIADTFQAMFVKAVKALRVGDPNLTDTQMGPVINLRHLQKIQQIIREATAEGARVICGDRMPASLTRGCFWEPTVLIDVSENSSIVQQETFGPVVLIQSATDIKDAVRLANNVPHGLLASLLTNDQAAKKYFEENIEAGILKLVPGPLRVQPDVPFGGWKASRNGPPEHGEWNRIFYTRPQTIYG